MISFLREFKSHTPIKALLLAIVLSFSTKVISYKVIIGYLSEKGILDQISYIFNSLIHTSIVKLFIIACIGYLSFSVCRSIVKAVRQSQLKF